MANKNDFKSMGIDEDILSAIEDLGYEEPTAIQADSIAKLMKGYDLIGQSRTGTGKTTAFSIPLIELIDPEDRRLQGVVLCPTRELCLQISEEIRKLLKYKSGIRVVPIYGGQPINHQIMDIRKGIHIAVATPGRLIDHLRRHTLKLDMVQMVVLDEADEMLHIGFRDDIELILSQMPEPRQTVLYSATMPEDVRQMAQKYMEDPVEILAPDDDQLTVDPVEQKYFEVKERSKNDALLRLLECEAPSHALIFCNTKKRVSDLVDFLKDKGYAIDGLHGDMKQIQRDLVMKQYRKGDLTLLAATDVAARGINVDDIDIVFNYDLSEEPESYVHRIGRTARAGRSGKAYSFVVGRELTHLKEIMDYTGAVIEPSRLPTLQEIEQARAAALVGEIVSTVKDIASGSVSVDKYRELLETTKAQCKGIDSDQNETDLIALSLIRKLLFVDDNKDDTLSKIPTHVLKDASGKMLKLHFSVGRKHKIRVKDIVGAIAGECGVPGSEIGRIDILETFSYVEVPAELSNDVLRLMDGSKIKGNKVRVALASQDNKNEK